MKVTYKDVKNQPPLSDEQLASLSRKDLLVIARNERRIRIFLQEFINEEAARLHEMEERIFVLEGNYFRVKSRLYSPSSEKSPKPVDKTKPSGGLRRPRATATKLPSERYPNAEIIEKDITYEQVPACKCCGLEMHDSGLVETSEYLTVIPKKYIIVRQHRHKYRCTKCHGDMATTPAIPRVIPGSSYSDEMIVDATLSKYCDLLPMERYCQIAKRQGFVGLPPHSLIGASFQLATFLQPAYARLKEETLQTSVLLADETPHRMLEGDAKQGWYLWGFFQENSCFYECHDTRSGDVASKVLQDSNCKVLVTDVYSGYKKAVRKTNEIRQEKDQLPIQMAYCNSHARRGFVGSKNDSPEESTFMVEQYREIYRLESTAKGQPEPTVLEVRKDMVPIFETMRTHAEMAVSGFSEKSGIGKAFSYFLKNYEGLTVFLSNPLVPIDNNSSERGLRSHVVGRKTWYGTHSKAGARAAAIHFSLVEACKRNGINPRTYYTELIQRIHANEPIFTPREFCQTPEKVVKQESS